MHAPGTVWHPFVPPFGYIKCAVCTCKVRLYHKRSLKLFGYSGYSIAPVTRSFCLLVSSQMFENKPRFILTFTYNLGLDWRSALRESHLSATHLQPTNQTQPLGLL